MDENENKTWLTDELWENTDDETAAFAFEQGEKYMQQLEDTAKAITDRCYMVLGALLTICPLLITVSFSTDNSAINAICYMFTSCCIGLSIYIMGVVKPSSGASIGRPPQDFLKLPILKHKMETKRCIKIYELENLQHKIHKLETDNETRASKQTIILYSSIALLSASLVLVLIARIFFDPF